MNCKFHRQPRPQRHRSYLQIIYRPDKIELYDCSYIRRAESDAAVLVLLHCCRDCWRDCWRVRERILLEFEL